MISGIPAFFIVVYGLLSKNVLIMSLCIGVYGFCLLPIIGIGNSFIATEFHPISPAATIGITHISNSIVGTILTYLVTFLIEVNKWYGLGSLLLFTVLSSLIALFVKETISKKKQLSVYSHLGSIVLT